jgi:rhodanese-related sulfurtransferase
MWVDPLKVATWIHNLPKQQEVIIFCVHGGSVSQSVQKQLAENGVPARYLEGGIEKFLKD